MKSFVWIEKLKGIIKMQAFFWSIPIS